MLINTECTNSQDLAPVFFSPIGFIDSTTAITPVQLLASEILSNTENRINNMLGSWRIVPQTEFKFAIDMLRETMRREKLKQYEKARKLWPLLDEIMLKIVADPEIRWITDIAKQLSLPDPEKVTLELKVAIKAELLPAIHLTSAVKAENQNDHHQFHIESVRKITRNTKTSDWVEAWDLYNSLQKARDHLYANNYKEKLQGIRAYISLIARNEGKYLRGLLGEEVVAVVLAIVYSMEYDDKFERLLFNNTSNTLSSLLPWSFDIRRAQSLARLLKAKKALENRRITEAAFGFALAKNLDPYTNYANKFQPELEIEIEKFHEILKRGRNPYNHGADLFEHFFLDIMAELRAPNKKLQEEALTAAICQTAHRLGMDPSSAEEMEAVVALIVKLNDEKEWDWGFANICSSIATDYPIAEGINWGIVQEAVQKGQSLQRQKDVGESSNEALEDASEDTKKDNEIFSIEERKKWINTTLANAINPGIFATCLPCKEPIAIPLNISFGNEVFFDKLTESNCVKHEWDDIWIVHYWIFSPLDLIAKTMGATGVLLIIIGLIIYNFRGIQEEQRNKAYADLWSAAQMAQDEVLKAAREFVNVGAPYNLDKRTNEVARYYRIALLKKGISLSIEGRGNEVLQLSEEAIKLDIWEGKQR